MDRPRPCGCKGCRTCLLCEKEFGIQEKSFSESFKDQRQLVFCPDCNCLYTGWDVDAVQRQHPLHNAEPGIPFDGVLVQRNFLNANEERQLMQGIDEMPWVQSQSGRRKQNFGPKTNFKKQKLGVGSFCGFPAFSRFVQERFETVPVLKGFQTIEQCSLEYDPTKGASIDPHIDDCWIWGERVVTVNCLSDSVLTLSLYKAECPPRYNLSLVDGYKHALLADLMEPSLLESTFANTVVRIPMPNRSLIVLYGPSRYQWEHCVLREDIHQRRVCVAYREFTIPYLPDDDGRGQKNTTKQIELGKLVLDQSKLFWDHKDMAIVTSS